MEFRYKNIYLFLVLVLSIFLIRPIKCNEKCDWQKEFDKLSFNGIVIKKYIDHSNHSIPRVIINNYEKTRIDTFDLLGDNSNAFSALVILDTIVKNASDSRIIIRRMIKPDLFIKVDFGCN